MKGKKIYILTDHGKFLRRITYCEKGVFEFNGGWAKVEQLQKNKDLTSKVRLILDLR